MINYLVTHLSSVIAASSPGLGPVKRPPLILPSSKHGEQIQHQLISWIESYFFENFSSQLQSFLLTIVDENPMKLMKELVFCSSEGLLAKAGEGGCQEETPNRHRSRR